MLDILFVTGAEEMALNREVNGIMLLATKLLQAGFSAKITHFCKCDSFGKDYPTFLQDMTEHILSFHPKCVSFYTLWPTYHNMVRLAKELKALRPELHIIFGGPQATGTALETMNAFDYIDFVCAGEGENTIVPFITQLLREEKPDFTGIYGLVYRLVLYAELSYFGIGGMYDLCAFALEKSFADLNCFVHRYVVKVDSSDVYLIH